MKTETKPKPKVPKIPDAPETRAPALAAEAWPIDRPKPYAKNPRRNDAAVEKVAASIREFGWAQPIVVDGDGVIIIGHTRLKAAKKLGLKTVPVLVRADLTPEKVAALRLADNKTAELAEWDEPLLAAELDALVGAVDMEQFGFLSVSPDDFGTEFGLPTGGGDGLLRFPRRFAGATPDNSRRHRRARRRIRRDIRKQAKERQRACGDLPRVSGIAGGRPWGSVKKSSFA